MDLERVKSSSTSTAFYPFLNTELNPSAFILKIPF